MENRQNISRGCPMTATVELIGGKWKMIILSAIDRGANRFGLLQRVIPAISKKALTADLRQLESDGLLTRTVFAEMPPRVEYAITPLGESLRPVLALISDWGRDHGFLVIAKRGVPP